METIDRIEYLQSDYQDPVQEQPPKYPLFLRVVQFGFMTLGRLFPKPAARMAYRLFSTPRTRARHKTSDAILESARLFEVLYGKTILKGYEWGSGEQTVLLAHGWESRGTAMRTFVPDLVQAGYRVLAFDGPGHGDSGGKRTNLLHFGGAVKAFINYAGGVHAIITHSFGGASTVFAMTKLDQDIAVEKLVLIGVPNKMSNVLENALNTLKAPKPTAKQFIHIIEGKLEAPVDTVDLEAAYPQIKVGEALIVHDKRDYVVPMSSAKAIYKAWKNSTLLVVDGYGHYRLMKNPDVIERVVQFVKGVGR